MATKTGKPQTGDKIEFRLAILGDLEEHFVGTVISWRRYDRVQVRVDEVLFTKGRGLPVGGVWTADEYSAAMYLGNGTVKVLPA